MKILAIFLSLFLSSPFAQTTTALQSVLVDTTSAESLQRGAKLFMNYCSGCHSLRYLRYNRMADDLGLTTFDGHVDVALLRNNLIFTTARIDDPIRISMPEVDARQWFGKVPPDLSLKARERGVDWIYTYLKSFYADSKRPFGTNNLLVPNVAMPDALAPLRGKVIARHAPTGGMYLETIQEGTVSEQHLDQMLEDIVTFLAYVAEPAKNKRIHLGFVFLPFLFVCLLVVWRLKKNYWKHLFF